LRRRRRGSGNIRNTGLDCRDHAKAQGLAGYINALSGRRLVYALDVNDAGTITDIADVIGVIQDEAQISTIIYQMN
jgi:hypothetical protein